MARAERFANMTEVRDELHRVRREREARKRQLAEHWDQLQDPDLRRELVSEGLRHALSGIPWLRTLRGMFTPDRATLGQALGMAFGASRRTKAGRVAGTIAALVLPEVLERFATPERTERLFTEVRRSFERVRDRWRERRSKPEED
ncbi:MAG: hypothetical protein ABI432_15315 [Flavobacteriales bacterium]